MATKDNTLTPQDEYECDHCGTKVAIDDSKCPCCGEPFEEDEEVSDFECSNCGGVVAAIETRCPHCGEMFEEETEGDVDPLVSLARSFSINLTNERGQVDLFTCMQCRAPARLDDKFCRSCGRALKPVGEPVGRIAQSNLQDGEVTCGECGAAIEAKSEVCPQCGVVFDPKSKFEPTEISAASVEKVIGDPSVESESSFECEGSEEPVDSSDGFCSHCGRKLAPLSQVESGVLPAPAAPLNSRPWFLRFLRFGAMLAVFGIIGGCPSFWETRRVEHLQWYETLFAEGQNTYGGKVTRLADLSPERKAVLRGTLEKARTDATHRGIIWALYLFRLLVTLILAYGYWQFKWWLPSFYGSMLLMPFLDRLVQARLYGENVLPNSNLFWFLLFGVLVAGGLVWLYLNSPNIKRYFNA